jgi:hypothetical protein
MNMQHFHDFYFLQALEAAVVREIASNPELEFVKSVEKFQDDLDKTTEKVYTNMALRVFMYLYAACLGEARHAKDTVARERFVKVSGKMGRGDWFAHAADYAPSKANLEVLLSVYRQDWRSGYGGEAWYNIAEALTEYEKTPPAAWLDHVVDLEHNNGTAFSKPDGLNTIFFDVTYPARFGNFLDYKFSKDILVKHPHFIDNLGVSPRIYSLLERYSKIFNRPIVTHAVPELENLSSYVVEWGDGVLSLDEKWADWMSIDANNKPDVKYLLEEAGLYNAYPSYYTTEEFTEKCKIAHKRALGLLNSKVATSAMKAKLSKYVNSYIKRNTKKCKIAKAKELFSIMPCKVTNDGQGINTLSFNLKFQEGYGMKTETGFTVDLKIGYNLRGDGYVERKYGDIVLWVGTEYQYITNPILEALVD